MNVLMPEYAYLKRFRIFIDDLKNYFLGHSLGLVSDYLFEILIGMTRFQVDVNCHASLILKWRHGIPKFMLLLLNCSTVSQI